MRKGHLRALVAKTATSAPSIAHAYACHDCANHDPTHACAHVVASFWMGEYADILLRNARGGGPSTPPPPRKMRVPCTCYMPEPPRGQNVVPSSGGLSFWEVSAERHDTFPSPPAVGFWFLR